MGRKRKNTADWAIQNRVVAFLMLCAQGVHFSVRNPVHKYLPSLGLLPE